MSEAGPGSLEGRFASLCDGVAQLLLELEGRDADGAVAAIAEQLRSHADPALLLRELAGGTGSGVALQNRTLLQQISPGSFEMPEPLYGSARRSPFRIVDVGGQLVEGMNHVYARMLTALPCSVVAFDGLPDAARARSDAEPGVRVLTGFIGSGGPGSFRVTRYAPASSLYRPNQALLAPLLGLPEMLEVEQEFPVETVRLDDIADLGGCDFLKLDVQGAELDVLKGAGRTLEETLAVHVEVEFAEIYEGQPLFCEVDATLRAAGFDLMDFTDVGYGRYRNAPALTQSRLLWADAVYFKNDRKLMELGELAAIRAAAIAHYNYHKYDLATHLIEVGDVVGGRGLMAHYAWAQRQLG